MNRRIARLILLTLLVTLLTAACQIVLPPATEETQTTVTLVADGTTQTLDVNPNYTVNDVLRLLDLSLGPLDRINPPGYSRIEDGMTITIVRVREETVVTQEVVPFERRTVPNEGLPEGETQLLQAGANGLAEVTYRVTYEDGVEAGRSEVRRVLLETPQDEVIMVGRQSELPTVTVNGTLAYIYNGNAWVMRENSANRRPLTLDGGLDGRVFELSADGGRLLYTRTADAAPEEGEAGPAPFKSLWAVL
ncbi:MAG TPA: G5 domain-containing protein, partial [Aggregatilineales bacterium]|nr:G5 domain-containing protein [Aggregatilineales bacterium]